MHPLKGDLDRISAESRTGHTECLESRIESGDATKRGNWIAQQPLQQRTARNQSFPELCRSPKLRISDSSIKHVQGKLDNTNARVIDRSGELVRRVDRGAETVGSCPDELRRGGEVRVIRIEHHVRVVEIQDLDGISSKTGERRLEFLPGMLGTRELRVNGEGCTMPTDDQLGIPVSGSGIQCSDSDFGRRVEQRLTLLVFTPLTSHDTVLLGELGRTEDDLH